ncbi:MAG: hypothetical protein O3A95_03950 [Planctomycetota bacterium]|nr:hypothetical protein [Planctomycetota bacterium]MDA1113436.1 hypothetical protein [Planctomycetota bacterium]
MYRHVGSFGLADIFTVTGALAAVGPPVAMIFMTVGGGSMEHGPPTPLELVSPAPEENEEF